MSSGCGDVLSLADLQTAKKHQVFEAEVITGKSGGVASGADIDYATNQVTGQVQKTLPAVLRDAGFRPASFNFTTGGTIAENEADLVVLWPIPDGGDGNYYKWKGTLPKVIPASSTPLTTGGISDSAWSPVTDNTLREELAATGGSLLIADFSSPDAYSYIAEATSFAQLRTITPRAEGVKIKLRGYRNGSELGGGVFIGHLTAKADNGITVASGGGSYYWEREDVKNIDVFMAGAHGDGSTDDYSYFQAAIDYVQTLNLVAGAVTGSVIAPFGYTYKIGTQLVLSVPLKFHVLGNLYWSASTDYAIKVGTGATWNVRYDIYIKNAWADSTLSFPTTINSAGVGLMTINSMTFSTVKIDTATGFNNRILYLLADGSLGYQQVVQHNTFDLGQIVNSGIGISLLSLDAASSSAQANRFYIRNIYQNYKNIEIDDSTHSASNSNTFYINAMDNCRDVGLDLYSHLNYFYIGFAGAPGTALRENSSYGNTIEFGNSVPTDLVINFGATAANTIRCANPGPASLPASQGVASGTNYQNTYGIPLSIYGNLTFSTAGTVQVYYGKNSGALSVVQTISGSADTSIPVHLTIPPGYYYKLFTTSGTVNLGTLSLNAAL